MNHATPDLDTIRDACQRLGDKVRETPVWSWRGREIEACLGRGTQPFLKLELFQYGGTFKPRAALLNAMALSPEALRHGLTAVSAGNHAIATAYAAHSLGTSAKVVMPRAANEARVAACRGYGAEVVLVSDGKEAFERVGQIQTEEKRAFIHPFEGELTTLGTATVGYELGRQVAALDAVVVPIGGGGLCGGMAGAIKQLQPECLVYGVEPEGADTMHRSFAAGTPQALDHVATIADSLAPPHAGRQALALCRQHVEGLVKVDDSAMQRAMGLLFADLKLAVEPAGAAATAALCGPLRERLRGMRVGVMVCGSNIDLATFARQALPYHPAAR